MNNDLLLQVVLSVIAIALSFTSSFSLHVIKSVSAGYSDDLEQNDPEKFRQILQVRQEFSDVFFAFTSLDVLGLVISAFTLPMAILTLVESYHGVLDYQFAVVFFVSFFVVVILTKPLPLALAERFADNSILVVLKISSFAKWFTYPIVIVCSQLVNVIVGKQSTEEAREEMHDEIHAIIDEAKEEGTLDAEEYRILTNIMRFSNVTVKDVMTPRNVVFSMSASTSIRAASKKNELQMYSRFPVCEDESLDSVIGYCMTRDVLHAALNNNDDKELRVLTRDVHFIPENVQLDKALEEFLQRRQHLFIVVDEYGGVDGLITMEDVVETILGAEIVDEVDRVVDMRQLASQRRDKRIAMNSPITE